MSLERSSVFDASAQVRFRLAVVPKFLLAAIDANLALCRPTAGCPRRGAWHDRIGIRSTTTTHCAVDRPALQKPAGRDSSEDGRKPQGTAPGDR